MVVADVFSPNKSVPRTVMVAVAIIQMFAVAVLWGHQSGSLPGPIDVVRAASRLWFESNLAGELATSFVTSLEAIAITAVLSLALSYLTVVPAARPIVSVVSACSFFGLVGFTFAFTLAFGGGHALKVALLVFGMTPFFVRSMTAVIAGIPREQFEYARTMRMGEWRVVWEVVVLGKAHEAIDILRQNAAMGWMMLTMVEGFVRSEGGIGVLMLNENRLLRLDAVFAAQLVILGVGLAQDHFIEVMRNIACPYAALRKERR